TANGTGLSGGPVVFTFSSTPDAVSRINIDVPDVALVGQPFGFVTIDLFDQFNNVKTDFEGDLSLTAVDSINESTPAGGVLSPSVVTFTAADLGQKNLTNVTYDTEGSIKLKISDGTHEDISKAVAVVTSLGSCPDADGV